MSRHSLVRALIPATLSALLSTAAVAQQGHSHGHSQSHSQGAADIGQPAKAGQTARTVEITVGDLYFEPTSVQVKAGETVRFVVRNTGGLLHEFGLATASMHAMRRDAMAMMVDHGMVTDTAVNHQMKTMDHSKMQGMAHGDMSVEVPHAVLVEPGKSAELVWTFPKDTALEFACSMPGHYEAGMAGRVEYRP